MSYILDALKKSDQERQRGKSPGLDAPAAPVEDKPGRRPVWLVVVVVALLVNAGFLVWWLKPWQSGGGPVADSVQKPVRLADQAAGTHPAAPKPKAEERTAQERQPKAPPPPDPKRPAAPARPPGAPMVANGPAAPGKPAGPPPRPPVSRAEPPAPPDAEPSPESAGEPSPAPAHRPPVPATAPPPAPAAPPQVASTEPAPASLAAATTPTPEKTEPPRPTATAKAEKLKKPAEPPVASSGSLKEAASTRAAAASSAQPARPASAREIPPELKALSALQSPSETASASKPAVKFHELPSGVRQSVPRIAVSMLVYSKTPASRWANVNGQKMVEGQEVSAGLKIEEITSDGAIFSYQGHRFYKGVIGDD